MNCPRCQKETRDGALYVRGLGASLHWSSRRDVAFLSKRDLEPINLSEISLAPTGWQAVLEGWRCQACGMIMFNVSSAQNDVEGSAR